MIIKDYGTPLKSDNNVTMNSPERYYSNNVTIELEDDPPTNINLSRVKRNTLNRSCLNPPTLKTNSSLELDDEPLTHEKYISIMKSFESKGVSTRDRLKMLLKLKRMREE